MANVYRSNTVFVPSGGAKTSEVKYAIADDINAAFVAIDAQFTTDGAAVSQISTPVLVDVQYATDGADGRVFAMDVNIIVNGKTHTTKRLRIVTADTGAAAFDAVEAQVVTDGDVLQGILLTPKDPLTQEPLSTDGLDIAVFANAGGGD